MQKAFFVRFFGITIILMLFGVIQVSALELSLTSVQQVSSVWGDNDFIEPPIWERKKRTPSRRVIRRQTIVPSLSSEERNTLSSRIKRVIVINKCEDGVPQVVPTSIPRYIDTPEQKEIRVYIRDAYVGLYEDGILICLMPTVTGDRKNPTSDIAGLNVTQDQTVEYYSKKLYPNKRGKLTPAYMKYATRIGRPDKPVGSSGYFLHTGNISTWNGRVSGTNPNPPVGSHGCIRLDEQHARFLYYWVKPNTKVYVLVDFKKQERITQR